MTFPAVQDPSFTFAPGDHVCAFYNGSRNMLDDIVADYVTRGLEAGNQVFCMVDDPPAIHRRVPSELVTKDGMLNVLTEDEAYMPGGHFSKDTFIRGMEDRMAAASGHGYDSFRAVGDESFIVRHGVDIGEWFAAEAELNGIGQNYPHFFFCLYDVDLFDGDTVMYVLRTHPRVYVNGILISNPHFQAA
ncbi:MAG: MEDS domain-containing protein [Actinobacteria bacterium]|nr:MEDS domain-containing protein [Actinomycetota bacterium]